MKAIRFVVGVALLLVGGSAAQAAKSVKVTMNSVTPEGVGKSIGTITIKETKDGVTLEPKLKDLTPGEHGFHLHEKASCAPAEKDGKMTAAQSAGGHFDPDNTKAHKGPGGGGHKGDLPKLVVSDKGEAKDKLEVKGLTLADFQGKSLMIHEGGDNYSDAPKPLGGGGARIACGVVK
ncbi:MAG TPA: superoxide dismutase [Cu-Zn] SodC [Polyangia bacterium]|nr:superoxide dismutase [Cu-Zn] SodC [Polyangia bacterium]